MANEEVVILNADEVLDQHIGMLSEQWEETVPATEEQESIHKQLMEALRVKKEYMELYDKNVKDKKSNRREAIKFVITTFFQAVGIVVPTTLGLGLLGFSKKGSYFTADEAKVFNWFYQSANRK